ncbi:MAG TPA: hypothetical protein VFF65_10820 [Phycisphaerales bacterium]|nr:hypothetical protein [Phycisphaerales bacterium]
MDKRGVDNLSGDARTRLQKQMVLLWAELAAGLIPFGDLDDVRTDLADVRRRPDGEFELGTISPRVKGLAESVADARDHEESLGISLLNTQRRYFDTLSDGFGQLTAFRERYPELSDAQFAELCVNVPGLYRAVEPHIDFWADVSRKFWKEADDVATAHLLAFKGSRAVVAGDISLVSPVSDVCYTSLLMDTVVVPDPVHRVATGIMQLGTRKSAVFYFVKHMLRLLSLREFATADQEFPLVVLTRAEEPAVALRQMGCEEDALYHINTAFGSNFASEEEARDYLKKLNRLTSWSDGLWMQQGSFTAIKEPSYRKGIKPIARWSRRAPQTSSDRRSVTRSFWNRLDGWRW